MTLNTNTEPDTTSEKTPEDQGKEWTTLSLPELEDAYWEKVAPTLKTQGYDPEEHRPSYEWLHEHGYSSLIYALREYHNQTFAEFWNTTLDLADDPNAYNWGIEDDETINFLEAYLDSLRDRGELSETTVQTHRYRLGTYVRAYNAENGHDELISVVDPGGETPAHKAVDECWATFDKIHTDLESNRTKERIHSAVDDWYSHLVRRKRAAVNPADGLDDEFRWEHQPSSNPALTPEHVRKLYAAAEATEERLLIVALAAWGLRSGEVASLHRSQFNIDAETPYISFTTRKNGPGEVSVMYGLSVYETRVAELVGDEWNEYLFPSKQSETGHIAPQTVRNRFHELVERADLPETVGGVRPIPQMARRFWYDAYSSVLEHILEGLDPIADEQGSSDPGVVLREYLSDERNRKLRQEQMRKRLSVAFEGIECM